MLANYLKIARWRLDLTGQRLETELPGSRNSRPIRAGLGHHQVWDRFAE